MTTKKAAPKSNGKPTPTAGETQKPRKPSATGTHSAKRLAAALSKKLREIDSRQMREAIHGDYDQYDKYQAQKIAAIKEAIKAGLKLTDIQVADGSAMYYEARRTKTQITFEWLNTGGDLYVSGFGKVVSVPLATGQKLIKSFNPNNF